MVKKEEQLEMGGQAVIEGVMMRSREGYSIALRKHNNDIKVKVVPHQPLARKKKFFSLPFIRGAVGLFEMLIVGIKALNYSAAEWEEPDTEKDDESEAPVENEEHSAEHIDDTDHASPSSPEKKKKKKESETLTALQIAGMMAFAFSLAILMVVVIPNVATSYIGRLGIWNQAEQSQELSGENLSEGVAAQELGAAIAPSEKSALVEEKKPFSYNLIAGALRAVIIFAYIFVISFLKDIRRIFQYHGAEHKVVYAFEHGEAITVENARKFGTVHPRCGSSFLGIVIFITIIVFAFIAYMVNTLFPSFTTLPFVVKKISLISLHILFLPIVAGTSYEIMKFSAKRQNNPLLKLLLFPGILFQSITTREPDEKQIEVAIASLNAALNAGAGEKESVLHPTTDL